LTLLTPASGYECARGECVDIDECADPSLNTCQSFESCDNEDGGFSCIFDYDSNCPNEKYSVQWKGAKFTKIMFRSETNIVTLVNVNIGKGFDVRRNTYIGKSRVYNQN